MGIVTPDTVESEICRGCTLPVEVCSLLSDCEMGRYVLVPLGVVVMPEL